MKIMKISTSHAVAQLVFWVGGSTASSSLGASVTSSSGSAPTGTSYPSGFDMMRSWGNLSPYTDAPGFDLSKGFAQGCELSQVHVLHRHAERYPTSADSDFMKLFASLLANYTKNYPNTKVGTGPLEFLNDWDYLLGQDTLLPTGAATEATAGANFWSQYGRLLYRTPKAEAKWNASLNLYPNGKPLLKPTFHTTGFPRILESARWWLSGFFDNKSGNGSHSQYELVIIPEEQGFNNTLSPSDSCPTITASGRTGAAEVKAFVSSLTKDAAERIISILPSDFTFGLDEAEIGQMILGMFYLCPYEYATLGNSPFCSLFTEQEWRDFEYVLDLEYYDIFGFGSPSGRAHGIGYVQELAARLEHKLIQSGDSSINSTYDDNCEDFPLDQPLFLDMSHDDVIVGVLTALGLDYFKYGPQGMPSNVSHAPPRHFKLSQVTPFGAHLSSEIWTCPKNTSFSDLQTQLYSNPDLSSNTNTKHYIRLVLNNAPIRLDGISTCDGSVNGFCPLKKFLRQVPHLVNEAMYQEACFGSYNTSVQVGNGQPPRI